ncbi:MAG TPA: protein-S-isoprenylcysteine O-methyltransferase [Methylibium sp.]
MRVEVSSARARTNATAGVYGAKLRAWFPLVLFAFALAAYLWRRGAQWQWPELAWFAAATLQMMIRWPHVERNRGNLTVEQRVSLGDQWAMLAVFLSLLCIPVCYLATPWLDAWDYPLADGWSVLGALMMLVSLWVFHRSHVELGRNWSPSLEIRQGHSLVTQGIYARVRHPMYASIWLFALAQPLLLHNWVAGALAIPGFGILYFLRVRAEEALMRETFGEAYEAYMRRTGRLWPRFRARS